MSNSPKTLGVIAALMLLAGFATSQLLVGSGYPFPASPWTLLVSIPVIGLAVLIFSLPIRRYTRSLAKSERAKRPSNHYSYRVLLLARAGQLTAAGFLGWHLGALIWAGMFAPIAELQASGWLGTAGSTLMLLSCYLAEWNCRAPKDSGDRG